MAGAEGDGVVVEVGPGVGELLGSDPRELVGLPLSALAPDGHAEAVERLLHDAATARAGAPVGPRPLLLRGSLEAVLCPVSARVVEGGAGGRLVVAVGLERPSAAAWEDAAVLHAVSGLRGESVWAYDEERDRFWWIAKSPDRDGQARSGPLPLRRMLARVHPEDVARVESVFWSLRRGEREVADVRFRYPDGRGGYRWLGTVSRSVRLGFDGARRIAGHTVDHTDAVEREESLTREHRLQSRLVRELAAAFVAAKSEEELTDAILHRVAPAFAGTGTLLAFVERGRMRVTFGDGIDLAMARSLDGMRLDAPKPLARAVRTGRIEVIGSREAYRAAWPQAHGLLDATTAESFVMVPFAAERGRPLGGWVITYDVAHRLGERERTLLEVIAELAGQAWERIRLSAARLELAGALQRTMLPSTLPAVDGFEVAARYVPANEGLDVGGDWYDVIALPDGGVACVIGDVQGHHIQAAALMGQVRTAMHAYAWENPSPDSVLERTNELMLQMGATGFATCFYALVEPSGRMLSARAGHVPPILCGAGGTSAPHTPGGLPLGVDHGTRYPLTRGFLAPGETLALVTDGLVEGPRLSLDAGIALACRTVEASAGASADDVADSLMSCARATQHEDDRAVLVVRRAPSDRDGQDGRDGAGVG
ncbi:SpoIIE family protein phosphatase [Streptomyces sp. NPDC001941]|uniref:SpoIIE family protein phosphatase n=1 Tax=Streptomyces sp. NPDC001941 TaxID=3154659 RepID=UPI003319D09C